MAEKQIYHFPNEIDTVEVSSIGAKIEIRPHDSAEIYVEYDNPRSTPEFCAVLSGKTLTLKENMGLSIFGAKPCDNYTIKVFLPALCFAKLKVNTASGGAEIEGVTARNFDLNTASGSIFINAYFENIKMQAASGSITLTNPTGNAAKHINSCTVSGSATITGYRAESFSLHSVSGRISYDSASGEGEISVTSGCVDVNYADWCADLSVSAISGNVNLTFPENTGLDISFSGVSGTLKTDIGNPRGSYMNLGKGTSGVFGGENLHKLKVSLTSGSVTASQRPSAAVNND